MIKDRKDYMRAYYEANKERLKTKRKPQPRTPARIAAEQKYKEKIRILKEIANEPSGPVFLTKDSHARCTDS